MLLKNLSGDMRAKYGVRMIFMITLLCSMGLNLILSIVAIRKIDNIKVEVKLPGEVTKGFWVDKEKVSAEYLEQMGMFVLDLGINRTPIDVDYKTQKLLQYIGPGNYSEVEAGLMAAAQQIKETQASTVFSTRAVTTNPRDNSVAFTGTLQTYIGNKLVSQNLTAFLIKFKYANGRINLVDLKETNAKDPLSEPAPSASAAAR
jgi:conjugal transfer pilus assembly protein TraE